METLGSSIFCAGYLVNNQQLVEAPANTSATQDVKRVLADVKCFCISTHLKAKTLEQLAPTGEFLMAPKIAYQPSELNILQKKVRELFWSNLPHQNGIPKMPERISWNFYKVELSFQYPEGISAPAKWSDVHNMNTKCCKCLLENAHEIKFISKT